MPVFKDRHVMSNIPVKEAMRRQVNRLADDVAIAVCIRRMIKLKINAVHPCCRFRQNNGSIVCRMPLDSVPAPAAPALPAA